MQHKIFINLPIKDLDASKEFYTKLGFTINKQFTNEDASCVVINDSIYVMILKEEFFKRFTQKTIIDAKTSVESLLALSVDSKEAVDDFVKRAIDAGGKLGRGPEDLGFMYQNGFEDPDGHIWEIFWMDPNHIEKT